LSTFGSAQYDTALESVYSEAAAPAATLKLQVAERLAAHRNRTHRRIAPAPEPPAMPAAERATRIAASVAERYAKSQTYRAFLAAEAERAVQQAAAEAEAAERHDEAIASQQRQLLADLEADSMAKLDAEKLLELCAETSPQPDLLTPPKLSKPARQSASPRPLKAASAGPAQLSEHVHATPETQISGLTVRLFEGNESTGSFAHHSVPVTRASDCLVTPADKAAELAEALILDEEIAFRRDPVFEEAPEPAMPLPANLIEFPRQLVAARKARPRHAEGPLLMDAGEEPGLTQLRIFEVEPAQISLTPSVEAAAPEWSSIWLEAIAPDPLAPEAFRAESRTLLFDAAGPGAGIPTSSRPIVLTGRPANWRPQTAPISSRLLAATLDGALVLVAFITFTAGFALVTGTAADSVPSLLAGQIGVAASCIVAAAVLGFFSVAYHLLFCSFADGTPGMRCARIALCTFSDAGPTRAAMRRRVAASLLSAFALGLGFLWAVIDEDRLGWHDRITGIYPRKY
jgi:uncharacterized RDD family membrane protein YckC